MRLCNCCKQVKKIDDFSDRKYTCKVCRNHNKQASRYKVVYGTTMEHINTLKQEQHNKCAICSKTEPGNKRLSVDHNHITGEIRGLLCNNCNRAIGLLQDNVNIIKNAVSYLTKYSNK
jgi:hypothetical protein